MTDFKIAIGKKVTWTSQSGGYGKTKTGEVLGRLENWEDLNLVVDAWLKKKDVMISQSNVHGARISEASRYVVVIMSPKGHPHIYTPHVSVLERQNRT